MNGWLGCVVVGMLSCAAAPVVVLEEPTRPEPPSVPGAVSLLLTGGSPELTVAAHQLTARARTRLEALGHSVRPDADLAVEVDVRASRGARAAQLCVMVVGRVIRGGQRFTSVELCRIACAAAQPGLLGEYGAMISSVGLLFVDEEQRVQGPAAEAVDALLADLSRYARVRAPEPGQGSPPREGSAEP